MSVHISSEKNKYHVVIPVNTGIQLNNDPLQAILLLLDKSCSRQFYCIPTLHGGHSRVRGKDMVVI